MNLSKLKNMINEGDMSIHALRYLIECKGECEYLDYKEKLEFHNDYNDACFARDAVAMRNAGGGYIIVGVKDKTWLPLGLGTQFLTDTKQLRDIVRKTTGLEIEVDVVPHRLFITGYYKNFALILVRSANKLRKLRTPSVVRTSFNPKEKWGIRSGDIYFRKGDETVRVSSDAELNDLLEDLQDRHNQSSLENESKLPSPFEVETGLYRLLPLEYENYVDRPEIENQLKNALEGDPRIWIVNLFGPGGVGKSALASRITRCYYDHKAFDCILQLSAKDNKLTNRGISALSPSLYSLENLLKNILVLFGFGDYIKSSVEDQKDIVKLLLTDYRTLLVLDNMETVKDGRIMNFVRNLPASSQSKVLLTSRTRTSGWEMPVRVAELSLEEVGRFTEIKANELRLSPLKCMDEILPRIHKASGGLPLAIQWILGEYAVTGNWDLATEHVGSTDSPLLEFSFRNSWNVLSEDAKKALAVLSIFDEPPTASIWANAVGFTIERLEKAVEGAAGLVETTFVSEKVDRKTGLKTYHALPITLGFAQNELATMGRLEIDARTNYQKYVQQMELVAVETERYSSLFEEFQVERDTEKRAIILARKADTARSSLNYDAAEELYSQALEIDPRSIYVLVNYGILKHEMGQVGRAIQLMEDAGRRCNKGNGFWVYYNLTKIYDDIRNRVKVEACLRKALTYNPKHKIARHQLGMVVSRLGRYEEAVSIFDEIIRDELALPGGPTYTLVATYKAKLISLQKAGESYLEKQFLVEAKRQLEKWPQLADRISEIDSILD